MRDWLRARLHLVSLVLLPIALVVLGVDWALSDATRQETLVTAGLFAGGVLLWGLKLRVVSRRQDPAEDE